MNVVLGIARIATDLCFEFRDLKHAEIADDDFFSCAEVVRHRFKELVDDFRDDGLREFEMAELVGDFDNQVALSERWHEKIG